MQEKTGPLVSICIPNYNYGRFLDACLGSVLRQTYHNYEVIFRDNASTDDSFAIALKYAALFEGRMSISRARATSRAFENVKICQREAKGKYILFLCSDDILKPAFLERCVGVMERYPNVGSVITDREDLDDAGNITHSPPFYDQSCIIPGEAQAAVYMMAGIGVPSQMLYRSEVFRRVDDEYIILQYATDWFSNFVTACHADVGYICEPLSQYRVHRGNSTHQSTVELSGVLEHYLMLQAFCSIAGRHGLQAPQRRKEEAIKKLGGMCLRYAAQLLGEGERDIAGRYLLLAPVFDPAIAGGATYLLLQECLPLEAGQVAQRLAQLNETAALKRTCSYPPPAGFVPLAL